MSGGLNSASASALAPEFQSRAASDETCGQRSVYVSVRLSAAEKAQLEREAAGESVSGYVRDRLFGVSKRAKASYSIADQQALARVLRALAESNLALDLEAICQAAEEEDLPVEPILSAKLQEACDDVAAMRRDLVKALGLRPK